MAEEIVGGKKRLGFLLQGHGVTFHGCIAKLMTRARLNMNRWRDGEYIFCEFYLTADYWSQIDRIIDREGKVKRGLVILWKK